MVKPGCLGQFLGFVYNVILATVCSSESWKNFEPQCFPYQRSEEALFSILVGESAPRREDASEHFFLHLAYPS